jgi:hypothetical protein
MLLDSSKMIFFIHVQVESDHVVMSVSGVLLVSTHKPTQFVPLHQFQRERAIFTHLVRIPFFKNYIKRKVSR